MSLQDLPPDALCEITSWLEGDDLYRLWSSGCGRLQLKLGEGGGAKRFAFKISTNSKLLPQLFWPSVTSALHHLTRFSLDYPRRNTNVAIHGANLTTLPATLEFLKLSFWTSLQVWYDALIVHGAPFPNLRTLEITTGEDEKQIPTIQALQWPKMLNSLSIGFDGLNVDPSTLPPNLTYFKSDTCVLSANDGSKFPSTLTSLYLGFGDDYGLPHHFLRILPLGLLHLTITGICKDGDRMWDWSCLPPQLQTLRGQFTDVQPEHVAKLPRSLTLLSHVEGNPEELLDVAPPNLTRATGFIPQHINRRTAMKLPKRLEFWGTTPLVEPDAIPHLPTGVTSIHCTAFDLKPLVSELDSMQLKRIPVALDLLILQSCVGMPSLTVLPDSLQYLTIFRGPLPLPAMEYFEGLNSIKLTTLNISTLSGNDTIAPENWDRLPKTLTSLIISIGDSLPVYSSALLPRSLRDIELSSDTQWDLHSDWFQNLPIRMSQVSLEGINRIKCSEKYESMIAKDGDATATGPLGSVFEFPRYLVTLCLSIYGDVSDSAPWIFACIAASLPKHVTRYHLKLPTRAGGIGGKLSNEELALLPAGCNYTGFASSSMFQTNRR